MEWIFSDIDLHFSKLTKGETDEKSFAICDSGISTKGFLSTSDCFSVVVDITFELLYDSAKLELPIDSIEGELLEFLEILEGIDKNFWFPTIIIG